MVLLSIASVQLYYSSSSLYQDVSGRAGSECRYRIQTYPDNVNHRKFGSVVVDPRLTEGLLLCTSLSDLENMSKTDAKSKQLLAHAIRDACINVGFLYGAYDPVRDI